MRKSRLLLVCIGIFMISLFLVGFISGDRKPELSELPISEVLKLEDSYRSERRDFCVEDFDALSNDPKVVAVFGKYPDIDNINIKTEWFNYLEDIYSKLDRNMGDFQDYLYPNGPIISFGYHMDGYITISIIKDANGLTVNAKNIHAAMFPPLEFSPDIPVVIEYGELPGLLSRTTLTRPVIGGLRITASGRNGTLGYATSGGYVTCEHIGVIIGTTVYQGGSSAGKVDKLSNYVSSDSCFVKFSNVEATIYWSQVTKLAVSNYRNPVVGEIAYKSGAATDVTIGYIVSIESVYHPAAGKMLSHQAKTTINAAPGDSGSPVFTLLGGDRANVLGIIWGGDGTYSYMSQTGRIANDLGVYPLTR